jgi:hypothetical protein
MYLDDLSGGLPGGLGVCKTLDGSSQCAPASDDNITAGEVLVLSFNQAVTLEELTFNNGEHKDNYLGQFGVAIDTTPLAVGGFTLYGAAPIFSTPLAGTVFSFIADASISLLDDVRRELYISSLKATAVPEPATALLLGFGVVPFMRRRRA